MKKIITTVGASLFTNYMKPEAQAKIEGYETIKGQFDVLDACADATDRKRQQEKEIKEQIHYWLTLDNPNACAEIKSLLKIAEQEGNIEVYLLATDTVLSVLACELIGDFLITNKANFAEGKVKEVHFKSKNDAIKGLQVKDKKSFEKNGLVNLQKKLNQIANNGFYWDDCIFNFTGGYKAIIPYLTIIAQIKKRPLYYIFEDTNEVIKIPQTPLAFDTDFFETYWNNFEKLSDGNIIDVNELENTYQFQQDAQSCIEIEEGDCCLNGLGGMLWEDYKSQFFTFYVANEDVQREIEAKQGIKRIVENKIWNKEILTSKTEKKGTHKVYDDGNNPFRVFYENYHNTICIYKVFENHDIYENYINTTLFNQGLISNPILKRMKKSLI